MGTKNKFNSNSNLRSSRHKNWGPPRCRSSCFLRNSNWSCSSNRKPLLPLSKNRSKKTLKEKPNLRCRKGSRRRWKRSKWKKNWNSSRGFRNNKESRKKKLLSSSSKGSWNNSSRNREKLRRLKRNLKSNSYSYRVFSGKKRDNNSNSKTKESKRPKCK